MLLKRRSFPNFYRLKYKFDIEKMQKQFFDMGLDNPDTYKDLNGEGTFKNLCREKKNLHEKFALSEERVAAKANSAMAIDSRAYRQFALTEYDDSKGQSPAERLAMTADRLQSFRACSNPASPEYVPEKDERNYSKRNEFATGYFKEVLDRFEAPVTRTRFAYMAPQFSIEPHIDYDTDYSIRVHIPIVTNPDCLLGVIRDGKQEEVHLPADGSCWFLNTGYLHYAANRGSTARVHLVICLAGQDDLSEIWTPSPRPSANADQVLLTP